MAGPETSAHYERLAGTYDQNRSYSDSFVAWMAGEMAGALALTSRDRIADVGCGTGLYTRRMLELVRPTAPILCVDPSEGMLGQLPSDHALRPVHASAEQLVGGAGGPRILSEDHSMPSRSKRRFTTSPPPTVDG